MKIKKMTVKAGAGAAAPAAGGAAIADRFKLDAQPVSNVGTVNKKAATCALVAGLVALALVGILTFVLYKHWEFLMPA